MLSSWCRPAASCRTLRSAACRHGATRCGAPVRLGDRSCLRGDHEATPPTDGHWSLGGNTKSAVAAVASVSYRDRYRLCIRSDRLARNKQRRGTLSPVGRDCRAFLSFLAHCGTPACLGAYSPLSVVRTRTTVVHGACVPPEWYKGGAAYKTHRVFGLSAPTRSRTTFKPSNLCARVHFPRVSARSTRLPALAL